MSRSRVLEYTLLSFALFLCQPLAFSQPAASFTSASLINVPGRSAAAESIATADFNGDGKPDLLVTGGCCGPSGANTVAVLLGNGDGTFSLASSFPLNLRSGGDGISQNNSNLVAVGDFNKDGKVDFAVCIAGVNSSGPTTNYLDIYLGDGTGNFSFSASYTVGVSGMGGDHYAIAAAYLTRNGNLDLVATNNSDNTVTVLLGKGGGTFYNGRLFPATTCGTGSCAPLNIAAGDLNHDGFPDLVIADGLGGVDVLLNNKNGTFAAPVFYPDNGDGYPYGEAGLAVGDLNRDGKLDVVLGSNSGASVFLGNGDGTLQTPVNYGFPNVDSLALADFNGDSKLDIIAADLYSSSVWVLLGDGDGTFKPPVAYATDWMPQSLAIADFNGDGHLDFVAGSDTSSFPTLALGNGDGTFRTGTNYDVGGNWIGEVAADFNNDGNLDVAVFASNAIQVMLGNSHGVLGTPINTPVSSPSPCIGWMAAGDVNNDGKADLVGMFGCSNPENPDGAIGVFLGNGNGTFQSAVFYSTGSTQNVSDVILADLRNSGKLDVLLSNADGSISVLLNQGGGIYGSATVISGVTKTAGTWITTGDFNGDGKLDLVAADPSNNSLNVLLGNGDGTFQSPVDYTVNGAGWVTVGDFNKDGKLDLATGGYGVAPAGGIAILLGNGDGSFGEPTYYSMDAGARYNLNPGYPGAVADVNLDGIPDLLVPLLDTHDDGPGYPCCYNPYNFGLAIFLGKGDGTFQYQDPLASTDQAVLVGANSTPIVTGDFNRDGATDAAVLNWNGSAGGAYVTALLNTTLPVSVSPLSISFGLRKVNTSTSQTVVLTNNTSSSLPVAVSISGPNHADFSYTSHCASSLNGGGQTCTIAVTFTPAGGGALAAALNLSVGGQPYSTQLSGSGLALTIKPASLNFGSITVGQHSAPMSVTVTNNGSTTISIVHPGIRIAGAAATDYSQTNNCGSSIAGGTSCTINVTFSPSATGTRSAEVQINSTDGKNPQYVRLTGTG